MFLPTLERASQLPPIVLVPLLLLLAPQTLEHAYQLPPIVLVPLLLLLTLDGTSFQTDACLFLPSLEHAYQLLPVFLVPLLILLALDEAGSLN